jgi:hypothetical protein
MAKKLLISIRDIKVNSVVDGNLDKNKLLPYISIAQDVNIQAILGSDLLDKLLTLTSPFSTPYAEVVELVRPVLINYAMVKYLPVAGIKISNGGVFKQSSQTGENLSKEEIDNIVESHRELAEYYSARLIDYLCYNGSSIPEYLTNNDDDVKPSSDSYFSGWVL